MLRPRIIPCLLVSNGGLVKTVRFKDPKYVGDPINAVKIFNEKMADELAVFDIDASVAGREPDLKMISHLAVECRMPLCYGGGITSVRQAKEIISLGVEKIALSSAFIAEPDLVTRIADALGRQSVVVVLDVKSTLFGKKHEVWTHNARSNSRRSVIELAELAQAHGAGEVVINSIDHDGQMKGYDLHLARSVKERLHVPVTFLGGAGSLSHFQELISACGLVGAAAGSLFVFKGPYRAVLINYPNPQQKEQLVRAGLAGRR